MEQRELQISKATIGELFYDIYGNRDYTITDRALDLIHYTIYEYRSTYKRGSLSQLWEHVRRLLALAVKSAYDRDSKVVTAQDVGWAIERSPYGEVGAI